MSNDSDVRKDFISISMLGFLVPFLMTSRFALHHIALAQT